jgi:hypothetical protein
MLLGYGNRLAEKGQGITRGSVPPNVDALQERALLRFEHTFYFGLVIAQKI